MRSSLAVCLSLLLLCGVGVHGDDARKNDEVVSQLREKLAAAGVDPLPAPPHNLGVHTACVMHGMACPDSYVAFLETLLNSPKKDPSAPAGSGPGTENKKKPKPPPKKEARANTAPVGGAGRRGHRATKKEDDPVGEAQLENLRRLRDVLQERLVERQSPESQWRCQEYHWLRKGLRLTLAVHEMMVERYWNFFVHRLLPCAVLTVVLTWVFFGDRIPQEHICSLLADDPSYLLNGQRLCRRKPLSVAELVMEREKYNFSDEDENAADNANINGEAAPMGDLERMVKHSRRTGANHRRERWLATRFALLEAHEESRLRVVVLKLRLVLSVLVFFSLLWTVFSLPMRVSDLQSGGGMLQQMFGMLCPSWMTTSVALYMGWSWVGGMVAYAGWEAVSAGEAIIKSDERAASLHEKILQDWGG
ncbi:hypothetical protein DQ04_00341100 [Trypanosoma grayi]|uniref:hypothetical protein n=1 Tax=Trypanosoma grayi TaxID=71804 RepID=UPI0004F41BE1|nr:hypothetical protein DQ04_00341100 [Trypanosoma grayi]KEG14695.1 hypothetical protein DQ04_00341100 [Trypanosoma grayi]